MNSAQNYLDQLSHQERFNIYEEQLVNVNNLKRKSSRDRKSANKIQDEYMEVNANQLDIYGLYIANCII